MSSEGTITLTHHISELARAARASARVSTSHASQDPAIMRISRRIEDVSPLTALSLVRGAPSIFWRSSDGSLEIAGFGHADLHSCDDPSLLNEMLARVEERVAASSSTVKYFGGIRFSIHGALA